MRNRDMPAIARPATQTVENDENGDLGYCLHHGFAGLTKREAAAIAAMQGLLMREQSVWPAKNGDELVAAAKMRRALRAKVAVAEADALFDELEKPE